MERCRGGPTALSAVAQRLDWWCSLHVSAAGPCHQASSLACTRKGIPVGVEDEGCESCDRSGDDLFQTCTVEEVEEEEEMETANSLVLVLESKHVMHQSLRTRAHRR